MGCLEMQTILAPAPGEARGRLAPMMSAPERDAFMSKFNLPGGKRATFRNTQGQEQMSVCHRGAGDDLPAPGKLNISSHYNAAAESGTQ